MQKKINIELKTNIKKSTFQTKEALEITLQENVPIIISDAISHWKALALWNPIFFLQEYGKKNVEVMDNLPNDGVPYLHFEEKHAINMKLADFICSLSNTNGSYLAQDDLGQFEEIETYFNFHDLIPKEFLKQPFQINLWIGAKTKSGLHYDYNDNFLVQLFGIKKVFLVAPSEARNIYPLSDNFTKSQVNPMESNYTLYPKFAKVCIYEGELGPGEVLFIPRGWYHYIYAPEMSISLNCWYGKTTNEWEMFKLFCKSGPKVWFGFVRSFLWDGVLKKPIQKRLFCSEPFGKLSYQYLIQKFRN